MIMMRNLLCCLIGIIKNHFDYRGLISKGLALNATGLGVY